MSQLNLSGADQEGSSRSYSVSSSSATLGPIRVGVVAQQPGPAIGTMLFIGLAAVLTDNVHALCACAGLFYARVLRVDGDHYHLEVAALPQYFSQSHPRRSAHVRSMTLSHDGFARLLEYDRSVAGRATCDIREIVEEHDATITRSQKQTTAQEAVSVSQAALTSEQQPLVNGAHPQRDAGEEKEDVDLEILTQVFVPRAVIRETFAAMHITAKRERRVHSALLAAAMEVVDRQIERCHTLRERDQLSATYEEIRAVRRWRRQRRNEGYGWQRVVTLAPVASGTGWDLVIGRPAA